MNLSEPFIRRPVMTVVLTVSAILFGVLAFMNLPVDALPAVDYPVIQVQASYPGAAPETVASTIATPLERQFMQIPGLEMMTSSSTQGNVSLTLQFDLNKNIDAAATDVQAAISRATGNLPQDLPSPPTFSKTNPNDQPIIYIALMSDTMTKGQIYDLAYTQVAQRMSIVSGVSRVDVYGTKSAVRIKADPSALAARGMTMNDLADAIARGTSMQGAGQFDGPSKTLLLKPQGQLTNAEEYGKLIVAMHDGAPVYLKDVAHAEDTVEDDRVNMRFYVRDSKVKVPASVAVLAVYRQAGANAVDVAKRLRDLKDEVDATLPAGATLLPIYDRSQTIVNSVMEVEETLIIAFILVVVVIFVFLGRATDTLIPVVALPMSLLLTFLVMNALDYTLNNLSLMALTLAIGFLVDDAIVFLENAVRRMEKFGETPMRAAINGAKEISFTIVSMTLSLGAVFLPLVFMSGIIGRIFQEFAITIIVAIMASGIVSLTLTPLMCARMLGQRGHGAKKSWVERVIGGVEHRVLGFYSTTLWFFLRHRWVSAFIWILCMGGTVWLFMNIPKAFLPPGDSSFAVGVIIGQEGSSPQVMRDYQMKAEQVLAENPAVRMAVSVTGIGRFLNSNMGIMFVSLERPENRPPLTTFTGETIEKPSINDLTTQMTGQMMAKMPGAMGVMTPQPVLEISTGAASRQGGQFSYSISGINPQEVYEAAGKISEKLMTQVGTIFAGPPISDLYLQTPNLKINILRDAASTYGVSVTNIESTLRNAYSQNYVYLIKKAEDQYQVILETKDDDRTQPEDLGKLYVRSDDGQRLIPLSAVATWEQTVGPQSVNHLNQFSSVTWNFNLVPGVPLEQATNFVEGVAKEVLPNHLRGTFQGEALTFKETMQSLTILMLLAVFVMYVIMAILYESYIHPITVLSTLPTAMVGGLATLWIYGIIVDGRPVEASLYAFIGLFMLMGIVKKNGIMIVDFAIQRIAGGATAEDAIHEASLDRFRPILMTTLAAVMGAVPIAFGLGASGEERRPLGLVIVGGLLVSQLITLYVTPVIYLYMELFQEKVLNRIPFFATHYEGHAEQAELERPHADTEDEDIPVAEIVRNGDGRNGNHH